MTNTEIFSKFGDTSISIKTIDKGVIWFSTPVNNFSVYLKLDNEEFLRAVFYVYDVNKSEPTNQIAYTYTLNKLYKMGYSLKKMEIFSDGKVVKNFE